MLESVKKKVALNQGDKGWRPRKKLPTWVERAGPVGRVLQQHDIVHPDDVALARIGVLDVGALRPRLGAEAVPDHPHGGVAGDEHVLGAVGVERGPVRLGRLQQRIERLELLAVGRALRNAEMERGQQHDLALGVEHVDLALKLIRRVVDDARVVDVALIDVPVHREAGRAPLVGDRVLAAHVEGHVHPLRLHVGEVGELALGDGVEHSFADHDLDHVVARHGHVVRAELASLERGEHRLVGIEGVHGSSIPVSARTCPAAPAGCTRTSGRSRASPEPVPRLRQRSGLTPLFRL